MVLRTLEAMGPQHGFGLAKRIQQISDGALDLNQGTLYPALLRLEQRRWIESRWGTSDANRNARFYQAGNVGQSGRPLLRRALVVAQVAFSVVLIGLAALFGHNLFALRSVDLGFRNQNVVTFTVDFPRGMRSEIRTPTRQLAEQLQTLPGVFSVSYGFPGPFLGLFLSRLTSAPKPFPIGYQSHQHQLFFRPRKPFPTRALPRFPPRNGPAIRTPRAVPWNQGGIGALRLPPTGSRGEAG